MLIKQENDTINCTDEFAEIYINVTFIMYINCLMLATHNIHCLYQIMIMCYEK
jgi:hypothetical protein